MATISCIPGRVIQTVALLVFIAVHETSGKYCDSPYENQIPGLCCKAEEEKNGFSTSHFPCDESGGCCGPVDGQYCCSRDSATVGIAVGCTALAVLILGVTFCIICCCVRRQNRSMGQEMYCDGCQINVRDVDGYRSRSYFRNQQLYRNAHATSDLPRNIESRDSERQSLDTYPSPGLPDNRDTPTHPMPSAPPPPPEPDTLAPPPSYDEVVNSPSGMFPVRQSGNPRTSAV